MSHSTISKCKSCNFLITERTFSTPKQGGIKRILTKQDWYLEKLLFHRHHIFKKKWSKFHMIKCLHIRQEEHGEYQEHTGLQKDLTGSQASNHEDRCFQKVFQWNPLFQPLGNKSPVKQQELFFSNDCAYASQHLHFLSEETSSLKVTLPATKRPSKTPCHSQDCSCSSQTAPPKQLSPDIKPTRSTTPAFAHPHLPSQLAQRT